MTTDIATLAQGDELYNIIVDRLLETHMFESSVLDIYHDVAAKYEHMNRSADSVIEQVAELLNEEVLILISEFARLADFPAEAVLEASEKWEEEYADKVPNIVEQVLFKHQKFCANKLVSSRMQTIAPTQNELFPQFREKAMSKI